MRNFWHRLLPRKNRFAGVDIGAGWIKVAVLEVSEGMPGVVSFQRYPSPPGVWTGECAEEELVNALAQVAADGLREVVSCIGGELVIARIAPFPPMSDQELQAAAEMEMKKYLPNPDEQYIFRCVRLGSRQPVGPGEELERVLLLAVPARVVYQYYGIFARAGLVVTAFDLQEFALWRVFARNTEGNLAVLDLGSRTSRLVVTRDGWIQFLRTLPLGGEELTRSLMEMLGVEAEAAERMKEEAGVLVENGQDLTGFMRLGEVLRGSLTGLANEVQRSLNFYAAQEGAPVERLLLSGGGSKLKGLAPFLEEFLGIPVNPGLADINLPPGESFDPACAVAIGLALRGVPDHA